MEPNSTQAQEAVIEVLQDNILLLEYKLAKCHQAMQTFIDRVDRGEARSITTYRVFKQVLEETK